MKREGEKQPLISALQVNRRSKNSFVIQLFPSFFFKKKKNAKEEKRKEENVVTTFFFFSCSAVAIVRMSLSHLWWFEDVLMASGLLVFFVFSTLLCFPFYALVDYLQLLSVVAATAIIIIVIVVAVASSFYCMFFPLSTISFAHFIFSVLSRAEKNIAGGYNNFSQY